MRRAWIECKLCGAEREDDEHFLLECVRLEEVRGEAIGCRDQDWRMQMRLWEDFCLSLIHI